MTGARRLTGDRGQVGGIEAIPFGLLVFVAGSLLIANAWAVVDAKFATDAGAQQAARAYAEAATAEAAEAGAIEAGFSAIEGHGRSRERATVEAIDGTRFERCARATFRAEYEVPALTIPFIGGFGDGFEIVSEASELVDPYRAEVGGEADGCD